MPAYSTHQLRQLRLHIGQNIHRQRIRRRMRLGTLAALSGISERSLDAYEIGRHDIGLKEILKIAYALEVEVGELIKQPASCA